MTVLLTADSAVAGRAALSDLMKETGASSATAGRYGIMPKRKNPVNLLERFAHGRPRGVGAEIERPVPAYPSHGLQGGEFLARIEADGKIGFVVTQIDIVAGTVFLDQGVFQNQRFLFRIGHHRIDTMHAIHEKRDLPTTVACSIKIAAQTSPQVFGLSHVEHSLVFTAHQIYAGGRREPLGIDLDFRHQTTPRRSYSEHLTITAWWRSGANFWQIGSRFALEFPKICPRHQYLTTLPKLRQPPGSPQILWTSLKTLI